MRKKLEISQKLNELDELRRTVDAIPDEVIRAYTAQKYVHHGRMNQEIWGNNKHETEEFYGNKSEQKR